MSRKYSGCIWRELGSLTRFPGPQPISIERRHMHLLKKNRYRVCPKNDGTRYLMVSDESGVYIINRSMQKTPFQGFRLVKYSVLDGELLANGTFVVHDAMIIGGVDISRMNLDDRITKYTAFIKSCPKVSGKIKIKEHFTLDRIHEIDPHAPGVDGLIFTPVDEPVRFGTHETLFKWKPLELNTIDFVWNNGNLCIQDGQIIQKAGFSGKNGEIYECQMQKNGVWIPVKQRTDKDYPNNKRTYERTLVNLREDIKFSDFININASKA